MNGNETAEVREDLNELQRKIADFRRELGIVMDAAPRQKSAAGGFRRSLRGLRRDRRQATVA
jgi:hypothetical protein